MKWIKYTINTTTEAEELVCALLAGLDITSVEIDNFIPVADDEREGGFFEELQPDLPDDDGSSRVSFYLEEAMDDEQVKEILEAITAGLIELATYLPVGAATITQEVSDEADWRDNWKEFFSGFAIGDIYVKPTWEELGAEAAGKRVVEIDPGVAFGTGKHESTQLVIEAMQRIGCEGKQVLDVGCGSGILSIVGVKLGASRVLGTDIDADCIASSYENCTVNGIDSTQVEFVCGNLIEDAQLQERTSAEPADLVLANILADIIIPMAPALAAAMKPEAVLITSGIIDFKEEAVAEALEAAGLSVEERNAMGEWRSIIAKKSE